MVALSEEGSGETLREVAAEPLVCVVGISRRAGGGGGFIAWA